MNFIIETFCDIMNNCSFRHWSFHHCENTGTLEILERIFWIFKNVTNDCIGRVSWNVFDYNTQLIVCVTQMSRLVSILTVKRFGRVKICRSINITNIKLFKCHCWINNNPKVQKFMFNFIITNERLHVSNVYRNSLIDDLLINM